MKIRLDDLRAAERGATEELEAMLWDRAEKLRGRTERSCDYGAMFRSEIRVGVRAMREVIEDREYFIKLALRSRR